MATPLLSRLQHLLADDHQPLPAYLSKLDSAEQADLAARIERRLDAESDALFSAVGFVSSLLPTALKVRVAETMLGPRATARMTAFVPERHAIAVAQGLKTSFLAEVAHHLQPAQVVSILEGSPDRLLLDVGRILLRQGQYELLAAFADHLSPPKLKVLAEQLGAPQDVVHIAQFMRDQPRLIRAAVQFSDPYLLRLMQGIAHHNAYDIAALVGQSMHITRQVTILRQLAPAEAARLAAHYRPEIMAQLVAYIDVEMAVHIALLLEGPVLGQLFNSLPAAQINRVLPYIGPEQAVASLPFVNLKRVEALWPAFQPGVQALLREMGRAYAPLRDVIQ